MSREQLPVFYLVVRRVSPAVSADLLAAHILDVLKGHFHAPFEIIVDCTMAEEVNIPPASAAARLLRLLPGRARANCQRLFVLAPSKYVVRACARLSKVLAKGEAEKIIVVSSPDQLLQHITESQLALPPAPAELQPPFTAFGPFVLQKAKPQSSPKQFELRVGTMVIVRVGLARAIAGHACEQQDALPLTRVKGIEATSDTITLLIEHGEGDVRRKTFVGDAAMRAAAAVRAALSRFEEQRAARTHAISLGEPSAETGWLTGELAAEHMHDPATAPGTLLAAGLLNLGAPSSSCREVAFYLLGALAESFQLTAVQLPTVRVRL